MSKESRIIKIDILSNGQKKSQFIEKTSFIIGRQEGCDVRIDDGNISREHLKISLADFQGFLAEDLGSSNGSFLNGTRLKAKISTPFNEHDNIVFGNSNSSLKVSFLEVSADTNDVVHELEKQVDKNPVHIELPAYEKSEKEMKLEFKSVGLDMAKAQTPSEQAQAIIREAEFLKHSLIKSAEAQQHKIVNEVRLKSKQVSDEAYQAYQKKLSDLVAQTKLQLSELRATTESHVEEKKKEAYAEIEQSWQIHKAAVERDRETELQRLEEETELKMSLQYEKMKTDILEMKEKLLREADLKIKEDKQKYKNQLDVDEKEAKSKLLIILKETKATQEELEDLSKKMVQAREDKVAAELELDKIQGEINTLNFSLELLEKKNQELKTSNVAIQEQLESFDKIKAEFLEKQSLAEEKYQRIKSEFNQLVDKKNHLETQIQGLEQTYSETKQRHKLELEENYRLQKQKEEEKFEAFKISELQELKKIRQDHSNSLKKMSLDLSQEIATKLELLSKKTEGSKEFDFEKNVELISSVIHVSAGADEGKDSDHQKQINNWKTRNNSEKKKYLSMGFVSAIFVYFLGTQVYKHFSKDSYAEQMRQVATERSQREKENRFVPNKVDTYHDNYVNATIYTDGFTDVYLNDKNQEEWVKKATYYFVNKWKVPEEKTIQVISNSKSLVQTINEAIPELKKDRLKQSLEKLNDLEAENVANQAKILGSQVRYEAYKKLEKEFFEQKLRNR